MKNLIFVSGIFLFFLACGANKSEKNSCPSSILYKVETRGLYVNIALNKSTITIEKGSNKENSKTIDLDKNYWAQICSMVEKINLKNIKNIKPTSEGRFSDRAAIAKLKIEFQDKVYESNNFDHGNPPEKLKELIEKILALSETAQ
ncbi:hypothetical protein [Cellulophaga sp. Hel_I_12]|uniref:hypothetical protein n=1 Tax=Cellulophaga sp. Hel_I_12 TaxID=1249972 RepID=UPI00069220BA|nr:hypothetical protein [Cellulophaga sp. Hel_I_12]